MNKINISSTTIFIDRIEDTPQVHKFFRGKLKKHVYADGVSLWLSPEGERTLIEALQRTPWTRERDGS